jgi:hypothetical protein
LLYLMFLSTPVFEVMTLFFQIFQPKVRERFHPILATCPFHLSLVHCIILIVRGINYGSQRF